MGAALGLYVPLSKRLLACVLAFVAGALISALAIELAFEGALELLHQGVQLHNAAWEFVGGGFAVGSIVYYSTSLILDRKGAAIRYPARFFEYALGASRARPGRLSVCCRDAICCAICRPTKLSRSCPACASVILNKERFFSVPVLPAMRSTSSRGERSRSSRIPFPVSSSPDRAPGKKACRTGRGTGVRRDGSAGRDSAHGRG